MAGVWRKTLVYLGLVEDDELDEYGYEDLEQDRAPARSKGRRQEAELAAVPRRDAVVRAIPTPSVGMHLVYPSTFNDAQEVGDKFREGYSVIVNLSNADSKLALRLVDFAAGLTYGLRGAMKRVDERVYLLTPAGVEVSAEEQRRFLEERGFFNQA